MSGNRFKVSSSRLKVDHETANLELETLNSILLIGFMGSGKSSIGRRVARRLRCEFLDLDREIEIAAGKKSPRFLPTKAKRNFAAAKHKPSADSSKNRPSSLRAVVLSRGPKIAFYCAKPPRSGTNIVYLQAGPDTLAERIRRQPGKRPLIDGPGKPLDYGATKRRVEELLAERAAFYQECATMVVLTDGRDFEE